MFQLNTVPYKKLRNRIATKRRASSVEILSTAAQLYEKYHLKTYNRWITWRSFKVNWIADNQ